MKTTLSLFLSLCCSASMAADDLKVRQSLDEISVAKEQAQIVMGQISSSEQRERLRVVSDKLTRAQDLLSSALGNGPRPPRPPQPPPPPHQSESIELYRSDSCSNSLVALANPTTDCNSLANAGSVWAVKAQGTCHDISDMPAAKACEVYKNMGDRHALKVYRSDQCSGSLVASLGRFSDCNSLSNKGDSAWAIEMDGRCQDISDTTVEKVCRSLRAAASPEAVKFYHNDSCKSDLIAAADRATNCDDFKGLSSAWAIEVNGQCQDITDTDIVNACQRFRP